VLVIAVLYTKNFSAIPWRLSTSEKYWVLKVLKRCFLPSINNGNGLEGIILAVEEKTNSKMELLLV